MSEVQLPPKPSDMFDRDREWAELTAFAADGNDGARLGIVSGRRRQGKSYLLQSLAEAAGGFYHVAVPASAAESLRLLGAAVGRFTGADVPPRPADWAQALDLLFGLAAERPLPVVLDEFPYLVHNAPDLSSRLHAALSIRAGRPRFLLCGSSASYMGGLAAGGCDLNLVVHGFGYREAADFWGIRDPRLAVLVHAVVGGTPAYRREFVDDDVPKGPADFDDWVCRTLLNPARRIHGDPLWLLASQPDLQDRAMYHSVLAAVATGHHTAGTIADTVGHRTTDVTHPLTALTRCGLLTATPDAFRVHRTVYRIAEPLILFHHAVVRPGGTALTWQRSRTVFLDKVVAPHFAQLCREWAVQYADPATFGGTPTSATVGTLPDHVVDVVVRGGDTLLSVGAADWHAPMGVPHLDRLHDVLRALSAHGVDTSHARPACYGASGFTPELQAAADRGEVVLVDLPRLYEGS
ncbi:hypothetical protein GCM10020367_28640 [Streptomyces sannanensis]|uniref:ATP-binding protein n=1 Tax=Streptomyces sannanensis TaxID=285536 RepID=A0ABP6SBJ6_9ACTN